MIRVFLTNIFIRVNVNDYHDPRIIKIISLLEDNNQTCVELDIRREFIGNVSQILLYVELDNLKLRISSNRHRPDYIHLGSTDADVEGYVKFMADVLEDKGCK